MLPTVLAIGALFFSNYYRFGSCFSSGYDQWMTPAGVGHDRFSPAFILPALHGFFLARGNHNVFLHYPLLLFAIAGLPRFCRRYPQEAGLIYGMFTLCLLGVVSLFSSWSGELCYGPRYLVHAAILASLPFIETMEIMRERIRSVAGVAFAIFTALTLAVSARLQINVASCNYFAYDELASLFAPFKHEKIDSYFRSTLHYGTVIGRLIDYVNGTGSFYPMSVLAKDPNLPEKAVTIAKLDAILKHIARPNYYFLFDRESSPAPSNLDTDTAPQQRQSG